MEYIAYPRHDGIGADGKFYWHGEAQYGIIDITNSKYADSKYLVDGIVYTDLTTGIAYKEGIVYVEGEGYNAWYVFTNYRGVKANGLEADGKYYIVGVLQQGYFTPNAEDAPNGEKWFAGADDVVVENGNRVAMTVSGKTLYADIVNYVVTLRDNFVEEDKEFYVDGELQSAEGVYEADGNKYYVGKDGKVQQSGQAEFGGITYDATNYVLAIRNGKIYNDVNDGKDKYYVDGVYKTDIFTVGDVTYIADENGALLTGQQTASDGKTYDCDATTYAATVRNGIKNDVEDGKDKYYVDGVYKTDIFTIGDVTYIADENGALLTGQQTASDGKTYDCATDGTYAATVRNGIKADVNDGNAKKYYVDGIVKVGFFTIGDKIYLTDADGKLLTGKQTVAEDEDRVYDFDAESFEGTKRDNYVVKDELYWLDGYTAKGIHYVNNVEMYFVDGALGTDEVMCPDGTVHKFENGLRVDGVDDMPAHSIKITLQLKNADGSYTKIGYREFYHYWNKEFKYTAPDYKCYAISIELKHGDNVVVHDHDLEIPNVLADYEIIVTYDTTAEKVHDFVLKDVKAATCKTPGTEYYECSRCAEKDQISTVVVPDAHNYEKTEVKATCTTNGSKTYTCEYCGDTYTIYTSKTAHSWVRDAENDVAASCGKAGKTAYKCEKDGCTAKKTVAVAATGKHVYDEENAEYKAATCSVNGYIKNECTECGKVELTVIPANGTHVYNKNDTPNEVLVNANGDKTMLYNCSECGAIGVVAVVVKAPVAALPGDDD